MTNNKTQTPHPQTNGSHDRLRRSIKEELFTISFIN
jgi:hypothetical protein